MRLIQCHVENFGILHDWDYTFQEGMNCILEENGWGKTTFAAFLKAMFYGLDFHARRKLAENERRRYMPWQGGAYGGSLDIQTGEKAYRIERFFGAKAREDTFVLYDKDTGLVSRDYSQAIGEELLGMDREAFSSSLYSVQKQMEAAMNDSLSARLTGEEQLPEMGKTDALFFSKSQDIEHFEAAMRLLGDQIRVYQKTGNRGKLVRLENELWTEKAELEKLVQRRDAPVLDDAEQKELERLEQYFGSREPDSAEIENVRHLYETWRETSGEIRTLKEQKQQAQSKERKQQPNFILAGSGFVLGIIGAAAAGLMDLLLGIGMLFGGILLMAAGLLWKRNSKTHGVREAEKETQAIEKKLAESRNKRQKAEQAMKQFFSPYDPEFTPETCMDAITKLCENKYRLQMLRAAKEKQEQKMEEQRILQREEQEALEASIGRKTEELEKARETVRILQMTSTYLEEARKQLAAGYQERMNRCFQNYLDRLGNHKAEDTSLDIQLNIKVEEGGSRKEKDYYSTGCQDRMNLGVRLALADALFPGEKPFLILDDPFANLDAEGIRQGKQLLREMAKEYQILYMTCHEVREIKPSV